MDLNSNPSIPIRTWILVELGMDLELLKHSTEETRLTDDELQGALDRLDRVHEALHRFDLRNASDDYELEVLPLVREIRSRKRSEGLVHLGIFADEVRSHATRLLTVIERDASQRQAFLVRMVSADAQAIFLAARRAVSLLIGDLIVRGKLQVVSPEVIQLGLEDVS